jgi:fructuronate reductase
VWIEAEGAFPSTMVDRIVPATKPEDIERLADLTGVLDLSPVMHEPFRQWVVEDRFVDGARPDLGAVGVQLVEDVTPFELMKLRCLNGTHSALAYLGYLAGHETISDTVDDPAFAGFVRHLWRAEIIPTIAPPPGEDLGRYADALFSRYANPAIRHRTWQIAMDGSQKLPQRILGTIADNRRATRHCPGLTLAVAAWMHYVGGVDERGQSIDVRDPLAPRLRALSDAAAGSAEKVDALLGVAQVFPGTLTSDRGFRDELIEAYAMLATEGASAAVSRFGA